MFSSSMRASENCELTAIVFMPVKSVTVADPPRISIEETMMFVAKLGATVRQSSYHL